MKTPQEIEDLKRNWLSDPCWDIEDTEGFEEYREELIAFSEQAQKEEQERRNAYYLRLADEYGKPGDLNLGREVSLLQSKVETNVSVAAEYLAGYLNVSSPDARSEVRFIIDSIIAATILQVQLNNLDQS